MRKRMQRGRKRWRKFLDDQAQSGLNVARFCRENKIPPASFYQWRKKFRTEEESPTINEPSLVPITIAGSPKVEFVFPQGVIMRVGAFPRKDLMYPKEREKPPFQTWEEIERQINGKTISEDEQADLWDCLYLSVNHIKTVLRHVQKHSIQPFLYPMFVTAAHTGARRAELLRSQVHNIDFDANVITMREKKRDRQRST